MKEMPNYYAIIPAEVRYDLELKDKAKLLYGEITALSDRNGYCFASNKYFAELYGVSITTISLLIKNLIEKGYIESEIIYKEGSKEILNRYLKIIKGGYLKNLKEGYLKKVKEGYLKKVKDNNININNTSNNNIKEIQKKYFNNTELNNLFLKFLDLRNKLKCKNTDRAITLLLNELNKYDDNTKMQMINNSIMNSWKSVYPIKENKNKLDNFNEVLKEVYDGTIKF
jgi:hypothetical protein